MTYEMAAKRRKDRRFLPPQPGHGASDGSLRFCVLGLLGGPGAVSSLVTVASGGHVAPGASAGNLTVGSTSFAAGSFFDVQLGGLNQGTQYDKLTVNGTAALGGTLNVSYIDGFTPSFGNSFTILTTSQANGVTGTFNNLIAPPLSGGFWRVTYNPNSVVLAAVIPEPDALALLLGGSMLRFATYRRRAT